MMSCPKTDELEKALERVNMMALDSDTRGSSQAMLNGAINKYTLKLNDLNMEAEYLKNLNQREIVAVKKHLKALIYTTVALGLYTGLRDEFSFGALYYLYFGAFNLVLYVVIN
mmetsp:Transcript_1511/g.2043  ORF Transcript_1511/g.2043 Transcript_1511/m.2043 type:complete len:113 (-) Transcript_1511:2417-2755(-)